MKHITTMALMLTLGAAGVYAHQKPLKMTFSGTGGASAINLQIPNTHTGEDNFAGDGTLDSFTVSSVEANPTSPQFSRPCSGPTHLYFPTGAASAVFRFEDGSLLKVRLV